MKTRIIFEMTNNAAQTESYVWNFTPEVSLKKITQGGWVIDSIENGITTLVNPAEPGSFDFIRISEAE